jgi:hypothetical protein
MNMLISNISRACLICVSAATGLASETSGACLIQSESAGAIRIGMTVAQVRQTVRGATLRASQDGDGLPLMQVIRDGLHTMDLYVNADVGVKEHSKIELIRVFDGACATRDGVHPGMPLSDVGRRYGRLKRLQVTEIESREFADFEKLPPWLQIQVGNGQAGIYPPGKRCTTNYATSAHIASLWVSRPESNRLREDEQACNAPQQRR